MARKMNNCLFFAISKFIKHGGFIVIRKSKYGNWSHVMWSKDLITFEHYVPIKLPLKYPLIQKFLFKGKIKQERL